MRQLLISPSPLSQSATRPRPCQVALASRPSPQRRYDLASALTHHYPETLRRLARLPTPRNHRPRHAHADGQQQQQQCPSPLAGTRLARHAVPLALVDAAQAPIAKHAAGRGGPRLPEALARDSAAREEASRSRCAECGDGYAFIREHARRGDEEGSVGRVAYACLGSCRRIKCSSSFNPSSCSFRSGPAHSRAQGCSSLGHVRQRRHGRLPARSGAVQPLTFSPFSSLFYFSLFSPPCQLS